MNGKNVYSWVRIEEKEYREAWILTNVAAPDALIKRSIVGMITRQAGGQFRWEIVKRETPLLDVEHGYELSVEVAKLRIELRLELEELTLRSKAAPSTKETKSFWQPWTFNDEPCFNHTTRTLDGDSDIDAHIHRCTDGWWYWRVYTVSENELDPSTCGYMATEELARSMVEKALGIQIKMEVKQEDYPHTWDDLCLEDESWVFIRARILPNGVRQDVDAVIERRSDGDWSWRIMVAPKYGVAQSKLDGILAAEEALVEEYSKRMA